MVEKILIYLDFTTQYVGNQEIVDLNERMGGEYHGCLGKRDSDIHTQNKESNQNHV